MRCVRSKADPEQTTYLNVFCFFHSDPNCPTWIKKITRTKSYLTLLSESTLRRTLSTMDLTLLGVGTAIGIGIYVMTAKLSRDTAGPAVILSIVLASVSVIMSGICYAEFSSRVPKCGSAYVYSYAGLGEIWAFIVGWTMIVEYPIVMAVLARTWSEYIDFISGGEIYTLFKEKVITWNNPFLAPFPDILALLLAITVVVIVAVGMRWAMIFNRAMFVFSIIALILLFVIGLFLVRPENWARNFAPYGVQGVLRAAAGGYYTFIGLLRRHHCCKQRGYTPAVPCSIVNYHDCYYGNSNILWTCNCLHPDSTI